MLKGWTLPQSASGRSSIVAPPPWHYSGEIIAVDFTASRDAIASLLPAGMEPTPDGAASVVFADWSSASDNDERVLADPAIGQYHEAYVVLHALRGDKRVGRVPLGTHPRSTLRLAWDLKVNGHRLRPGHYQITGRALDKKGKVLGLTKPVRLTVR